MNVSTLIRWKYEAADWNSRETTGDRISQLFALTPDSPTEWFLKLCNRTLSIRNLERSERQLKFAFWIADQQLNDKEVSQEEHSSSDYRILPTSLDRLHNQETTFLCCSVQWADEPNDEPQHIVQVNTARISSTTLLSLDWKSLPIQFDDNRKVVQFKSEKWTTSIGNEFELLATITKSNGRFLDGWHDFTLCLQSIVQSTDVWHLVVWLENRNGDWIEKREQFIRLLSGRDVAVWGWNGRTEDFRTTFAADQSITVRTRMLRVSSANTQDEFLVDDKENFEVQTTEKVQNEIVSKLTMETPMESQPKKNTIEAFKHEEQSQVEDEPKKSVELQSEVVSEYKQPEPCNETPNRRKRCIDQISTEQEVVTDEDTESHYVSNESLQSEETTRSEITDNDEHKEKPSNSRPYVRVGVIAAFAAVGCYVIFTKF
ncbi:hypothetical protein M3Y98_01176500 [Aphelenchoides besseyi]|nr:hypothetical protein M3Y98_01176500 [Aphelenchoides besseyi]KAI6211023.1 hypothetical protein M3Y96_00389500 [Aphelenchoides besseyi]